MPFLNFGINKMLNKIKDLLNEATSAGKDDKKGKVLKIDEEW